VYCCLVLIKQLAFSKLVWFVFLYFVLFVGLIFGVLVAGTDVVSDFVDSILATNLEMDPYGPPRKRPRPESGPLNGSHGANGGYGGVDDCKLSVHSRFFCCPVGCLSAYV
jgi:hypothetical protein